MEAFLVVFVKVEVSFWSFWSGQFPVFKGMLVAACCCRHVGGSIDRGQNNWHWNEMRKQSHVWFDTIHLIRSSV